MGFHYLMGRGYFMKKYMTVVLPYSPMAPKMAEAIENEANFQSENGYELVSFSINNSARAILVFKTSEE